MERDPLTQATLDKLSVLPSRIGDHLYRTSRLRVRLLKAKAALQATEDDALLTAGLDGKNAETRAAQLRERTATERRAVQTLEEELIYANCALDQEQTELLAVRAVARLLGGGREE